MNAKRRIRLILWWVAGSLALVVLSYGVYVAVAWIRYGHAAPAASAAESDTLLDRFMPDYEVVDRHQVRVAAPVEITFATASEMDLNESVIVRVIFKSRQLILRGTQPEPWQGPRSFVARVKAWGWGVLADVPGRETIMGAVTQPWVANVVFRALPPDDFAAFHEPGYVKIVWTMRADPISPTESVFRTETRAATTDPVARWKFRRYWAVFPRDCLDPACISPAGERRGGTTRTGNGSPASVQFPDKPPLNLGSIPSVSSGFRSWRSWDALGIVRGSA